MIAADLFSGVGGLSQGFISAGFNIAFAIEFDKEISVAYAKNHPGTEMINADIREVNPDELKKRHPHVDLIMGGPPCQGFSQKGKRLNLNDPRNFLFQQFVRFVESYKPKYFVLENVPNIITTANGYFKNQIIESFSRLGYTVRCGILSASEFGIPQDRHRAIFIGVLGNRAIDLPTPPHKRVTIQEAIYDLPFIASGEGTEIAAYDKKATSDYQSMMRGSSKKLYNHVATKHSDLALKRLSLIPKGAGREVLPAEHRTKSIYSGTWCRLLEDGIAPTITTRFDTPSSGRFTHPILNRCLTVREAARIQSFPDSFKFYGNKTSQMKQVGNAVPPLLAYAIAQQIINNDK